MTILDLTKIPEYTDEEIGKFRDLLNKEWTKRCQEAEAKEWKEWEDAGILNCDKCGEKLSGRIEIMLGYCAGGCDGD